MSDDQSPPPAAMEQDSPETPPIVIPSPDEEDEEEEDQNQQQQQQQHRHQHHQASTNLEQVASATPPRSEMMLNLPRDFLSLGGPQESSRQASHDHQMQQQQPKNPKFETKEDQQPTPPPATAGATAATATSTATSTTTSTATIKSPLITVHMAPSTTPPVLQKCSLLPPGLAVYPRPLATHEEVLRDKDLFLDTLRRLHGSLGFKSLTIPTIGGTQLDLHLLYKEVTARGGLQQVIKDRIWKEIKAVFHFPPTTTNASFVLRKYYTSLLHHYEQVYFFRNQGHVLPAPGDTSSGGDLFSDDSDAIRRRRKRSYDSTTEIDSGIATSCIGQTVTGSIVGKFEHGYLVSVSVGNETLKGVLYNVPPGDYVPQFTTTLTTTSASKLSNGVQQNLLDNVNADGEIRHKRRRRLGLRKKDPNAPKLNRSAYNFFFAEQRARIRLLQPNREISRMIGDSWSKLTDEQRLPYKQRGLVDKERYRKEIKQYRERMDLQRAGSVKDPDTESEIQATAEEAHEDDYVSDDNLEHHDPEENNGGEQKELQAVQQQQQLEEKQETLEFKSILSSSAQQDD